VVRDRVALAGGPVAVEFDSALPVEMGGRLVLVEVVENRAERLAVSSVNSAFCPSA
jgi:hypothetical protein